MRFISVYSINLSPSCSKSTWRQTISRRKKSKSCGISGTSEIVPHPSFSLSLHYYLIPPKSPTVPPISRREKNTFTATADRVPFLIRHPFSQGSIFYNMPGIFFLKQPLLSHLGWVHQSWKEREKEKKRESFRCFPIPEMVPLTLFSTPSPLSLFFLLLSSVQRRMGKALCAIFSILFFIRAFIREIHLLPQKCKHQKS